MNVGAQYTLKFPTFGMVYLRGGYKALFMEDSQYAATYGLGVKTDFISNYSLKVEFAYRTMGILGDVQSLGLSLLF